MSRPTFDLPLVSAAPATPDWHGYTPAEALAGALAAPEPDAPQGEYAVVGQAFQPDASPARQAGKPDLRVELLAPAGGPDAAFAAFHHGADAVYLGLKKFSARAEAENFTLDEVGEVTAYAHS